jgi:hypothetical protein
MGIQSCCIAMRLGSFRLGASYRPRIAGRTLKVDIDDASELFQRHLRHRSIAGDASVVDVDVESAESVHSLMHHAAYPIFIGDSTGDRPCATTAGCDGGVGSGAADIPPFRSSCDSKVRSTRAH